MTTRGFTPVNPSSKAVPIESSSKRNIINDDIVPLADQTETPSSRAARRNPLVAQLLNISQTEAEYLRFDATNLSAEDIDGRTTVHSGTVSKVHRKNGGSKRNMKSIKSHDRTGLSKVTRVTKTTSARISKPDESSNSHGSKEFTSVFLDQSSSIPCNSSSTLQTCQSFKYDAPSISQEGNAETSNVNDTVQPDNEIFKQSCSLASGFDELADDDLMAIFVDSVSLDPDQDISSDGQSITVKHDLPSSSFRREDSEGFPPWDVPSTTSHELSVFPDQLGTSTAFKETYMMNRRSRSFMPPSAEPNKAQVNASDCSKQPMHAPIVRPQFPGPIPERSRLIGISSSTYLRTCFRVGEALNEGSLAVRSNKDVVLELYAKVESSWREPPELKQHFILSDLFHDRPPKLDAVYELCKASDLWNYESAQFLGPKGKRRMCRCIGKLKRENNMWKMIVLSVWEATWDDVEYVRGIISAW